MNKLPELAHALIAEYVDDRAAYSLISLNYSPAWINKLLKRSKRDNTNQDTTGYLADIGDFAELKRHGHYNNPGCWVGAIVNNHLDMALWLQSEKCFIDSRVLPAALSSGDCRWLDWLDGHCHVNCYGQISDCYEIKDAVECGNMDCAIGVAVAMDSVSLFLDISQRYPNCWIGDVKRSIIMWAARNGAVKVLDHINKNLGSMSQGAYYKLVAGGAVGGVSTVAMQWLDATSRDYLREQGKRLTSLFTLHPLEFLVNEQHIPMINWLDRAGHLLTKDINDIAGSAANKDETVVLKAISHRADIDWTSVANDASVPAETAQWIRQRFLGDMQLTCCQVVIG